MDKRAARLCIAAMLTVTMVTAGFQLFFSDSYAATVYKVGSQGPVVTEIQKKLKNWGYTTAQPDGVYGQQTRAAVIKFQQKNGLSVDGVVGGKTLAALGINANTQEGASNDKNAVTSSEKMLLAKCITGEARGEPYDGQVAVGAVILNRVRHPEFPNSISGVIYQPLAFTAVADGQINLEPTASCLKAAEEALNGWDPSGGCLYYWNPVTATSKWIWSRQVVKVIGKHYFGL